MKPRVAFFDFACCEGCQLTVLNLEDQLLDLLSHIDVVTWREASSAQSDAYDIAFVEGSLTRESDLPRLQRIRDTADVVVALGACAAIGGINSIKNFHPLDRVRRYVYGDQADGFETAEVRPIDAVIPVEYYLHGCPIDKAEFVQVVKALLLGKAPEIPTYPVCVECKLKENVCVYDKGMTCLGPVTRAGCRARCPSNRSGCEGCRGLIDDLNADAQKDILAEHGLTVEDMLQQFQLYTGYSELARA